jgi:ATP-dependent helicase HrpB
MQRDAWLARGLPEEVRATLRRLRFAGIEIDVEEALLDACRACSARRAPAFDPLQALDWKRRRELERSAPERLRLPSGREVRLDYRDDGTVVAAAKLQELFGLADSPRLGAGGEPVTFSLLAPNGRPVQTTRDLRSFWNGAYAQVRAELRGRYPKHPWPEDPWSAEPTARIRPRKRRPAG